MDPQVALRSGAQELARALAPAGFAFAFIKEGEGSGGPFAVGEFRKENRRVEFHFRQSLGLVSYQVGEWTLSHSEYVRAVRELHGGGEAFYPGFSSDPLAGFVDLRQDLERFGDVFLNREDSEFIALAKWAALNPQRRGIEAS